MASHLVLNLCGLRVQPPMMHTFLKSKLSNSLAQLKEVWINIPFSLLQVTEIGQVKEGNASCLRGTYQRRCYDDYCLRDEEGNLYLLRAYYVPGTYKKQKLEQ